MYGVTSNTSVVSVTSLITSGKNVLIMASLVLCNKGPLASDLRNINITAICAGVSDAASRGLVAMVGAPLWSRL